MTVLPIVSENAAIEIESILLRLEITQGKESANSFMDSFLRYRPIIALNPESRPQKIIKGVIYYRFMYPNWNYVTYYEIVDGVPVINHISPR